MIFSFVSTFVVYVVFAMFFYKAFDLAFIFEARNIINIVLLVGVSWLPFYFTFDVIKRKYFSETHNRV
jgi:hypothetical protein